MKNIYNLTQHPATREQMESGVQEPTSDVKESIRKLLTIKASDLQDENLEFFNGRAKKLAGMVPHECDYALIGGQPTLMRFLDEALQSRGVWSVDAFTEREVTEKDGQKISTFRHVCFLDSTGDKV